MTPGGSAGTASGSYRVEPEPTGELRADMIAALPGAYPWGDVVDLMLAGPLAPLLAKLRAVEKLAEEWDTRHSGWCCTQSCPEPDGRHHDPTDPVSLNELAGAWGDNPPPIREHRTIPCPRTCSCQVGPYIAAVRAALDAS